MRTATNVDSAHETSKRCTSRAFSAGVAPDEENFRKLASKPPFVPQTFLLLVSAAGVWTAFLPLLCHLSTDPPKRAVAKRAPQRRWNYFPVSPLTVRGRETARRTAIKAINRSQRRTVTDNHNSVVRVCGTNPIKSSTTSCITASTFVNESRKGCPSSAPKAPSIDHLRTKCSATPAEALL